MARIKQLVAEARDLMDQEQIYDPQVLFELLYRGRRIHYSTVRKAVHLAKAGIYGDY